MATSVKTCYWCLHICHRKENVFKRRSVVTRAQPSNGAGGRSTATVQVELDRPPSRDLEQQLDDATLPEIPSTSVHDESMPQSWPSSELSQPSVLKAVAVEFMAQVGTLSETISSVAQHADTQHHSYNQNFFTAV